MAVAGVGVGVVGRGAGAGVSSSIVSSYWFRVGAQVGIACELIVALRDHRFGGDRLSRQRF